MGAHAVSQVMHCMSPSMVAHLHSLQVACIVLEDDCILALQLLRQGVAVQQRLELSQQRQSMLCGGDRLKGLVDECL